jgi:hypothetical protein
MRSRRSRSRTPADTRSWRIPPGCFDLLTLATVLLLAAAATATPPEPNATAGGSGADAASFRAVSLEALIGRLASIPGLSARFSEEKRIAMLEAPLRSEGRIHFVPPDRLARHADSPVLSTLLLDGDRLEFGDPDGSETIDLGSNPVARAFADGLIRILAGDLPGLHRLYRVEFQPETEKPWQLRLEPRLDPVRRFLARLGLRGRGLRLEEFSVEEIGGDLTITRFQEVDMQRRFDQAELDRLFRHPVQ